MLSFINSYFKSKIAAWLIYKTIRKPAAKSQGNLPTFLSRAAPSPSRIIQGSFALIMFWFNLYSCYFSCYSLFPGTLPVSASPSCACQVQTQRSWVVTPGRHRFRRRPLRRCLHHRNTTQGGPGEGACPPRRRNDGKALWGSLPYRSLESGPGWKLPQLPRH